MENKDIKSKKQEILDKIFIKEEDTLKDLEEIVDRSLKHFKINPEGERNILFEKHITKIFSKILLLLIGLYLMKHNKVRESESINISDIARMLNIRKTSLSKPLGILLNNGSIKKDNEGNYSIEHYKIKNILGELEKKDG